ncbi:MAG TPA: NAD-dependent DNA ligase LigA [Spirochaetales bacterium]|nr:NAD-dependent DNA ligase LigA [Spirochaetales bacterium]
MSDDAKSKRIRELEKLIQENQYLYYNEQPVISDEEFDALWDELARLDPTNPLLARIGEDKSEGWPKVQHVMPMGSQSKATTPEAFRAWAAKMPFGRYLVEYKLDGASLELQYKEGKLEKAVTRGDGTIGDDITPNALHINGVISSLAQKFSGGVRGEILMPRATLKLKYPDKANCRNAANGIMKRKDGVGSEDLDLVCYDAKGTIDGLPPFGNELEKVEWLKRMGFMTVEAQVFDSVEEIIAYRAKVMDQRPNLKYDIDGLVIKGLEIDEEDLARPRPEKQIAFKFSPEEAVTTLRKVEWSESGAVYTPIGVVEPVHLAGTTVQRANLCNPDMIRTMSLKIGSKVMITKRGEIIPKIENLVDNSMATGEIEMPTTCAACGSSLIDEGTRLYCPNPACPKKTFHRLEKWLSVVNAKEFGSVILKKLFDSGRVRQIPDLYTLTAQELSEFDRMGPTLAQKIVRNLHSVKELSLAEFVAGFDIEGVGVLVAEKLVQGGYTTLEALLAAKPEDLTSIEGIADTMARTIVSGLAERREEMLALLASGAITIKKPSSNKAGQGQTLSGLSFCFTGELTSMKRAEAERLVRDLGGVTKSSVTKGLSYLVTNDPNSGSEKNIRARELGIPIINEQEFLSLVSRSNHDGV